MKKPPLSLYPYFKAMIWIVGNSLWGLAPLAIFYMIRTYSTNVEAKIVVSELINSGIVLFACCTLMGAITLDVLLSDIKIQRVATSYFLFSTPPFVFGFVFLLYTLNIYDKLPKGIFSNFSVIYTVTISITFFYCLFSKAYLFSNKN